MKKMLNLYFLYDDNFVIREILWTQEDAEKMSKFYSCDYVLVQVINDPNVIDSLLSFPDSAYPNIGPDGYDFGYDYQYDT